MNIKKCSLKVMCAVLAGTMFASTLLPAFAAEAIITETPMDESVGDETGWTVDEENFEEIAVTYQQSSSYLVTIPKTIALGTNKKAAYSVKVSGDIDTNQRVYVAPVDGIADTDSIDFYMKDKAIGSKKADVVATVKQNKLYWNSEEVANAYEEANNSVSAPQLTAGTWEGTFQVEINLQTMAEQEHEHKYVDGKCECGAIDPDHEHNYEDGTCTICGKKDSYELAPATAYSNWDYTLDDTNNTITLNYYKGTETDVIVYANYEIGGKTYQTRIKSNSADATVSTPYMFNANVNQFPGGGFNYDRYITSITFGENIDTSNITNMGYMFYRCTKLTNLDISCFDTSNVTDMSCLFSGCNALTALDVTGFNTSNVTNMYQMFSNCYALTALDITGFNTSKVTNMFSMFATCSSLTNLDLSNFDTGNVTNMSSMFMNDRALSSLDVSSFETSNVTDMSQMFCQLDVLTSLDLSNFDTHKVTDMSSMFYNCPALKTIYVTEEKWSTSKAKVTSMFTYSGTSEVTYK